jgi:hypothetical protein
MIAPLPAFERVQAWLCLYCVKYFPNRTDADKLNCNEYSFIYSNCYGRFEL